MTPHPPSVTAAFGGPYFFMSCTLSRPQAAKVCNSLFLFAAPQAQEGEKLSFSFKVQRAYVITSYNNLTMPILISYD